MTGFYLPVQSLLLCLESTKLFESNDNILSATTSPFQELRTNSPAKKTVAGRLKFRCKDRIYYKARYEVCQESFVNDCRFSIPHREEIRVGGQSVRGGGAERGRNLRTCVFTDERRLAGCFGAIPTFAFVARRFWFESSSCTSSIASVSSPAVDEEATSSRGKLASALLGGTAISAVA